MEWFIVVVLQNDPELVLMSKERRKSMPSNMKMPIIKVTPSSPSPDPNHPDYPEFFEDPLYLKHTGSGRIFPFFKNFS